jgi:hypothetical protein
VAGATTSPSAGWLGADVGQLDDLANRCGSAGAATGRVAASLRTGLLEQPWAAGPFFQNFNSYVATRLIPTLATVAEALGSYRTVLAAHAEAQRRISAGEQVDLTQLAQYASPPEARSGRRKAPPDVETGAHLFGPLWGVEFDRAGQLGPATATTDGHLRAVGVTGDAGFTSTGELSAKASGRAYLLDGSAAGGLEWGPAEVAGELSGSGGVVDLSAGGSIDRDSVGAQGEAFAGARGGVSGEFDVGGLGAAVSVEGWAGAGVAAGFEVGRLDDGSYTLGGSFGFAWGLGGKLSGSVTVNPDEVRDSVESAAEALDEAAGRVRDWVTSGWGTTTRPR